LGNVFTVNSSINVTAVGAFVGGSSLGVTVPVAIYGFNPGTTLWDQVAGTYTTFSGTPPQLTGTAWFQDLNSPVTLNPGTIYAIVAANYGVPGADSHNVYWSGGTPPTFTGSPYISMGDPNNALFSRGPTTLDANLPGVGDFLNGGLGYGQIGGTFPAFAGATFDFTPVPEAATFGAAAVGLLGLVYIGRFARLRRKMKLA
jgi:hypothetical protein